MTLLSEKRDVQDQLINHLIGIGWRYLPPGDVQDSRSLAECEPFLPNIVRQQLIALNPGLVTPDNMHDLLHRLRGIRPNLAGNEDFLKALRGQWTLYDPAEKRERSLTLVDFENPERNDFTLTQEFLCVDYDRRRMDMVLFVNGFPVVVIENKSPTVPEAELEAFEQVQHIYTERVPEFLKFVQFFAACDIRLHYGATWNEDLKAFYRWKIELDARTGESLTRSHLLWWHGWRTGGQVAIPPQDLQGQFSSQILVGCSRSDRNRALRLDRALNWIANGIESDPRFSTRTRVDPHSA